MAADGEAFYDLPSPEQVAALELLARAALPAWDLPGDTRIELLAERENAVFTLDTERDRFVLRIHRAGYHSDAQLRSQVAWARALQDDDVIHTADVVDTARGEPFTVVTHDAVPEPRQVSLLRWVDGPQMSEAGGDTTKQLGLLGELMAALHDHAGGWEPPSGFECLSWDIAGLLGETPAWGRFWEVDDLAGEDRAVMVDFRRRARDDLEVFGATSDRFGLIHCDFLPENILVDGDRLTLLDFDDAGLGWHLFDIATALAMSALGGDFDEHLASFVDGYRSRRPLPADHLARLPLFLALRAATYAGWMQTRSHTQFAKDMAPIVVPAAVDAARDYLES